MDIRAFAAQPVGFFEVRPVDLGVVLQLAGLLDTMVECLSLGPVFGPTP